jgi:carboxylate-amine ligase
VGVAAGDPLELLASYATGAESYDEAVDADGSPRPEALPALAAVASQDLDVLAECLMEDLAGIGMTFRSLEGDERFVVDPVPRVIRAEEWARVEAGLAQRVRALNAFVADVYGGRRIVREGVVPERVVETAPNFEPLMDGLRPPNDIWIGVAGPDVVRTASGEFQVLEDNARSPSGFVYALAIREALSARLDGAVADLVRPVDQTPDWLAATFGAAAPDSARGEAQAVIVTDGPHSAAYWEHRWLATQLAIPLAEQHELEQHDRRLWLRPPGARTRRRIDVVYNRTSTDRLDTALGHSLLAPVRAGTVGMVNAFGAGVADDKLTHAYVEDMVRFYLGEEPELRSVQTLDLGRPEVLEEALDHFDQLVIKPRRGYGGIGVVVCRDADAADVEAARRAVRAHPGGYVAQQLVCLSTHPTVIEGRLARRHVDLRPYVFLAADDETHVMPGGVTRVALQEEALIVNASQNGGAKDTWVLREPCS